METNADNYVDQAIRTDTPITEELIRRLTDPDFIRLLHAGMGLCTESGEFMDMLKRHLFYGKPVDYVNAKEELGDVMWYTALAVDVIRTTINEVMTVNINKLRLRYPEKFCETKAIERDIVAERTLLETVPVKGASQRGLDWIKFAQEVLSHIENYTVPQYGDKGVDQASEYNSRDHVNQAKKYLARYGNNSRPGQEVLDLMKTAHYCQMAATELTLELERKANDLR